MNDLSQNNIKNPCSSALDLPTILEYQLLGTWRNDGRCGCDYPMPDFSGPGLCDFESDKPCCSRWGHCGGTHEYCEQLGCIDFRKSKKP